MRLNTGAVALLDDSMSPFEAVHVLLRKSEATMALRLQMRVMPRGYVVPWVCECASQVPLSVTDLQGVRLAEAWAATRGEADRLAALAYAEAAAYVGAGPLIAACAGWSGGTLVDARGTVVGTVGDHLQAHAAAGAIISLAACSGQVEERCHDFVERAMALLPVEVLR